MNKQLLEKLDRICNECNQKFSNYAILVKIVEESSELNKEIAKFLISDNIEEKRNLIRKIKEESADTFNMLFQLNKCYNFEAILNDKINKVENNLKTIWLNQIENTNKDNDFLMKYHNLQKEMEK